MSAASQARQYSRRYLNGWPTYDGFRADQVKRLANWLAKNPARSPIPDTSSHIPLDIAWPVTDTYPDYHTYRRKPKQMKLPLAG